MSQSIKIPKRLWQAIPESSEHHTNVLMLIRNAEPLLEGSPEFFPDYTIHGIKHVNAVLGHAERLIPDKTLESLKEKDVAFLICAVVLHDLGMFLAKAGVQKLLAGEYRRNCMEKLDKLTWEAEWDAYLNQIRRYPEEKLRYHFGIGTQVSLPQITNQNLTDMDRLIIGEFLRRQHHRIAHEIAVDKVPGGGVQDLFDGTTFTQRDRMAIGILARSHGMPIRDTEAYVNAKLGEAYRAPMYYLMAVLRMADYLDAGKGRAPKPRENLQGIEVPVSVIEWKWNQVIEEDDCYWDLDHAVRYIDAHPESTKVFVLVEKWLHAVQKELDMCWTVIAEKYRASEYNLSIHRIDSNIFKPGYRKDRNNTFLITEAKLKANPSLPRLLIAPLYGDDPSFGVRELVQNAVDACNERKYLGQKSAAAVPDGMVVVSLDTQKKTLTVSDNGVGMNEEVLLEYYLVAGASFRTSDSWLHDFTSGQSTKVLRTGKFGIGALAGFLLGKQFTVQTRHISEAKGYSFQMDLDARDLDIQRVDCEIGTTITARLSDYALNKLIDDKAWTEWFAFSSPVVSYEIDGVAHKPAIVIMAHNAEENPKWRSFRSAAGCQVLWREWSSRYYKSVLYVNGFRIPQISTIEAKDHGLPLPSPAISVIDKEGCLDVSLSRNRLTDEAVLYEVLREQFKRFLADLLALDFSSRAKAAERIGHRFYDFSEEYLEQSHIDLLYSKQGYSLLYGPFVELMSLSRILHIDMESNSHTEQYLAEIEMLQPGVPVAITGYFLSNGIIRLYNDSEGSINLHVSEFSRAESVWLLKEDPNRRVELWRPDYGHGRTQVWENERYVQLAHRGTPGGTSKEFRRDALYVTQLPVIAVLELQLQPPEKRRDNLFKQMLREYFGEDLWIPYNMDERRKKYPKAFEELEYHIARILAEREKENDAI